MEEKLRWLPQMRRLFLLSLIYDIAFLDLFTLTNKPNPIIGMIGLSIGGFVYVLSQLLNIIFLENISFFILIASAIWVIFSSFRRRPIYVFDIEKAKELVNKKGLKIENLDDIEHAKAIIEYSLYMTQQAKSPEEMKKYLDIAYETWYKVMKKKGYPLPYNFRRK